MRIEVIIERWAQACCGPELAVGDEGTWDISALNPESTSVGGHTQFIDDRHRTTSDEIPHQQISGRVRAIRGVTHPRIPVIGRPGAWQADSAITEVTDLAVIPRGGDPAFSSYWVEVEVPDDVILPPYRLSASALAAREADRGDAERAREQMTDEVGLVLEAAADHVVATYAHLATIIRNEQWSALTVEPHRAGATAVGWVRSTTDEDQITLSIGDSTWRLHANVENAELARQFVDAAAAGHVHEDVVDTSSRDKRLDTRVITDDGHEWVMSTLVPGVGAEDVVVMAGALAERLHRGSRTYAPWDLSAQPA